MTHKIRFLADAVNDLKRLDKTVNKRIIRRLRWFVENFDQIQKEALTGNLSHLYKFRVGAYRVLYGVDEEQHVILIYQVGHRRDIYHQ